MAVRTDAIGVAGSRDESEIAASPALARDKAVQMPPRGVEFLQNPREIPQSREIPDHIPDHFGWPPISMRWFDSSASCLTDSARPSRVSSDGRPVAEIADSQRFLLGEPSTKPRIDRDSGGFGCAATKCLGLPCPVFD